MLTFYASPLNSFDFALQTYMYDVFVYSLVVHSKTWVFQKQKNIVTM